ncbi:ATP-binding protein [Streptomyces griseoluteus]|uniref:ATP-binding protein n=1 Tax=Streptomyces griseoluteus TaxID=29306 RepID=UPI00367D156E
MPPTAADLIREPTLGPLVDHHAFALTAQEGLLVRARKEVRGMLGGRTDQGRIKDAVLVAVELLTNAIRHAGGAASLTLDVYGKSVLVGVVDCGRDTTAIPIDDDSLLANLPGNAATAASGGEDLAESGRGLFLVNTFANGRGVEPAREGKVVTVAFCLAGSAG